MIIRILVIILLLSWGYHEGRWWGLYAMFLISGIVASFLWKPKDQALPPDRLELEEGPSIRGHRDPTRPTYEDWGGITETFRQRGKP